MHTSVRSLKYDKQQWPYSTLPCGIPLSTGYESDSEELIFYFIESIMEEGLNPIYYLDGQAERKILFNNGLCGTLSKAFS